MERRLSKGQAALYELLQEKGRKQKTVSESEIAKRTGWKATTVHTYISEGHLKSLLVPENGKGFRSVGIDGMSKEEFHEKITQSQAIKGVNYGCKNKLARALAERSRENMVLGLELYNRPSLKNRVDSFVVLFCIAWEQLLKAKIIETKSENAIFKSSKKNRPRETIGLADCLSVSFPKKGDGIRQNIDLIKTLRDKAVHLLVPEIQAVLSQICQAGVINFARVFSEVTSTPFLSSDGVGLLTLVGDMRKPTVASLQDTYGKNIGSEINALISDLDNSIAQSKTKYYSIPIRHTLMIAKDPEDTNLKMSLTDSDKHTMIVEKPVDPNISHPYLQSAAIEKVITELETQLSQEDLLKRLGGRAKFTSYDFQAIAEKKGWKKSNNEFHRKNESPEYRKYSNKAVSEIVQLIVSHPDYLMGARASRKARIKARMYERKRGG